MKFFLLLCILTGFSPVLAQVYENPEDIEPLGPGSLVPEATLYSVNDDPVVFNPEFASKSVIVFYRGGWCPYCNVHLSELQNTLDEIKEKGYTLIAISPDSPQKLSETLSEHPLSYQLFSDPGLDLARKFNIVFKAPGKYIDMLKEHSNGKNQGYLPVPAVFICDEKGEITYVYTNADYKTRLSGEEILAALAE